MWTQRALSRALRLAYRSLGPSAFYSFCCNSQLDPVEPGALNWRCSGGSSCSCGSRGQNNANTCVGAGAGIVTAGGLWTETTPLTSQTIETRQRDSFVSSLSHPVNDTNTMSGVLRKRPPSSGGTQTEPSSCEMPGCHCRISQAH